MKKLISIVLAVVLMVLVVACSTTEVEEEPSEVVEEPEDQITIGVSISSLGNPFFVYMAGEIETYCEEKGVSCVILDSKEDPATELSNIEDLISQGVDGIVLNGCDSDASVSGVELATKANIPVSSVDRVINSDDLVAQFVSDNYYGGKLAGEYAKKLLTERYGEPKGKIVIMRGYIGITTDTDRYTGFVDVLQEYIDSGEIEIVAEQAAMWERNAAFEAMENILQAQDEVDLCYGMNDEMALGIAQALESSNRQDGVYVIGFDGAEAGIEAIKEGKMQGTVAQKFGLMGQQGVQAIIDYINGDLTETGVLNRVEVFMVTVDDVDTYEMQ